MCYGTSALVSVVPLLNATYGAPPTRHGDKIGWCSIVPTNQTPSWGESVWHWTSFYAWVWCAFFALAVTLASIAINHARVLRRQGKPVALPCELLCSGYAVMVIIAWLPLVCHDVFVRNNPNAIVPAWVPVFCNVCACSMGWLCSAWFFFCPSHRGILKQLLSGRLPWHFGNQNKEASQRTICSEPDIMITSPDFGNVVIFTSTGLLAIP
eukprot:c42328_g1_i1.p1 GENE.c42328_g1_i1~~c42328_g1_i1.p1  ORF type:complete len:210 (-),score=30.88 c42328_g1_i1:29-658(-)